MAPGKAKKTKRGQYHLNKVAKVKVRADQWKKGNLGEDRISQLPEDVLVSILSLLTLQDAGRTSVLSPRWRYLWTLTTGMLNFDAWESYGGVGPGDKIDHVTYVSWVNKILRLHQGQSIGEFRIQFPLLATDSHHIDSWVKFAFEKGVKVFELDLNRNGKHRSPCYDFSQVKNLVLRSYTTEGLQTSGMMKTASSAGFCSLTTLCLRYVNVTAEVIEQFLGNCPFLEQLQVTYSESLGYLKVDGPALKLKFLEISYCNLSVLEISAINLVSLTYKGHFMKSLLLKNCPVLSELCTLGDYFTSSMYKSRQHLNYLRQLQSLKLKLYHELPRKMTRLCCLKQLELEFCDVLGRRLISCTSLIEACPGLSRFTMRYSLKLDTTPLCPSDTVRDGRRRAAGASAVAKCQRHQCLKVVELVGFTGEEDELKFASHLLEIAAVSLKELVINPRPLYSFRWPRAVDYTQMLITKNLDEARKRATQLVEKLPRKANLVVL